MISIIKNNKLQKGLVFVAIAFTLQSCFVAKDYTRPEIEETENLYRTDNLPSDSLSMADVSWKTLFTDPFLNQYIEEGLQNNIDIRIAIQQIIAAEAYLKQGKAGYLPTINATGSASRSYISGNGQQGAILSSLGTDHIDQFELSGALSWEADIWGKIRSNKRAFAASYLQSVAAHQVLALDSQLEITQKTIESRTKGVETIKALKDAGITNQVAVDQNIAQLNSAQALEVDIETAIFRTENTLSILLGKTPQHFERSSLNKQKIDTELKLGVPSTLLSNRPDVMAAEYNLIQSFELTNVAKSNFYPSLTLTASSGFQSLSFEEVETSFMFFTILKTGQECKILESHN